MEDNRLDPRRHAYRPDLADEKLQGKVEAERFVPGALRRVRRASIALRREPVSTLAQVPRVAHSVLSGVRAAWGWADAPRPVPADDLLPERALSGDPEAVAALIWSVHRALLADVGLYDTATTYLERTPSLEATARSLLIHPNTVRYRLRRIADVTGYSPTDARGAFTLRIGLTLGRLAVDDLEV